MITESVPIGSIHPDPANARMHSERNIEAIKGSLARFGQQKPIVVDGDGVVRAGNGTLQAARDLGWEEISVVRSDLVGAEMTAFAIADNRAAELASWDLDVLARTMVALDEMEEIGHQDAGFTEDEMTNLLAVAQVPSQDQMREAFSGVATEENPLRQMAFLLTHEQAAVVADAIQGLLAKGLVPVDEVNSNMNGNALFLMARLHVEGGGGT